MTLENNNWNKVIIQWACEYILSKGYSLKNNLPETIQDTPWSYVIRFTTSDGYIYLKHTPEQLALEATIIEVLRNQFKAHVPIIIGYNTELNCFLMTDAGNPLRSILKQKFDEALLYKAIDQFTSLQIAVADRVNIFLDIGVPDWRLDKLPHLYKQLLSQKDMLVADGLSKAELNQLETLIPKVTDLCQKLSKYEIKETIVQPDFNDNNTLLDATLQNFTLIDLGEIAISHPFFSLLNILYVLKKHHNLTEDNRYLRIKNACLKNYTIFQPKKQLVEAFEIAHILSFVYGALASYRLMTACDSSKFTRSFQRHGRPSVPLKDFIAACTAT